MPTNIAFTTWEQNIAGGATQLQPPGGMPANLIHVSVQNRSETVDVFVAATAAAATAAAQRLDRNGGDAGFGMLDPDARLTSSIFAATDGPNARVACVAHYAA